MIAIRIFYESMAKLVLQLSQQNAGLKLGQRLRRWTNIEPAFGSTSYVTTPHVKYSDLTKYFHFWKIHTTKMNYLNNCAPTTT